MKRFDTATDTQLTDFATLPGSTAYALRLLADGGAQVADTEFVVRLDSSGNPIFFYDVAGEDTWFSLNLDPDAISLWSGNFGTGNIYRFDIDTGALLGMIGTGSGELFGVSVFGERTVVTAPEGGPGLLLTAICLAGVVGGAHVLRRRSASTA